MSGHPGSRCDHHRFCQADGWTEIRNARGQEVRHHITYELELPDGSVLRTRISRPANAESYGPSLWSTILKHQLCVTEVEFWACVKDKLPPNRGLVPAQLLANPLPAQLVAQLIYDAKVPEAEAGAMSLERAMETMIAHWSRRPSR